MAAQLRVAKLHVNNTFGENQASNQLSARGGGEDLGTCSELPVQPLQLD